MAKRKRKITKEEIAWWVYLAMMIALVIYGVYTSRLRQTEGAAIATQKKEKTRKYFKI